MKEKQSTINEILEQRSYINNAAPQYLFFKRLFDLTVSLLAILLLSLVLLAISVWIKIRSQGAVLYTEDKYGLKGRLFRSFEFAKTIKNSTLRKLPLLFNVLQGNMSLVGPQPASTKDGTQDTWFNLRLSAKPGITGLWQASGKTGGAGEMVRMDLKYIRERSFLFDMKIILKAICLMLSGKRPIEE